MKVRKPLRSARTQADLQLCERIGARSTPLRCKVLNVLEQARRPIGAYEVMARLDATFGHRHAPPTIYRTLAFLLEQQLAIRIASLNAYMAVSDAIAKDRAMLCICNQCGCAKQVQGLELHRIIDQSAAAIGFHVGKRIVELHGLCPRCVLTTTARLG
jgi:Fur family transcriptional regulator, zinc uptake regulator